MSLPKISHSLPTPKCYLQDKYSTFSKILDLADSRPAQRLGLFLVWNLRFRKEVRVGRKVLRFLNMNKDQYRYALKQVEASDLFTVVRHPNARATISRKESI